MRVLALSAFVFGALMPISSIRAQFPEPDQLPVQKEFPDPLVFMNGKRVSTANEWYKKRRPELKAQFEHYMYGEYPKVATKVTGKVLHEDRDAFGGKATLREIEVSIAEGCPPIYLLLAVPNSRKGPTPVFVGMNFCGNHEVVNDPKIRIPDARTWMYPQYPGVESKLMSGPSIRPLTAATPWRLFTTATSIRTARMRARGCDPGSSKKA
jgi:hypothetical protein